MTTTDIIIPIPLLPEQVRACESGMEYVKANFRTARLADVAKAACVSKFHFHNLFRRHFGRTLKAVITELQIEEAKRLMLAGVKLGLIAEKVGLSHQSHFTSRFKAIVGEPPKAWLTKMRPAAVLKHPTKQKRLVAIFDAYLKKFGTTATTAKEVSEWAIGNRLYPVPSRRDPLDECLKWERQLEAMTQ